MTIENGESKVGNGADRLIRAVIAEQDKRYEQRFEAQERATATALASTKEATVAALASAKEAVIKAEAAAEKRFEGFNEKLNDVVISWDTRHQEIINRLADSYSRKEAEVHQVNDTAAHSEVNSRLADLDKRISVTSGEKSEHKDIQSVFRSNVSMFVGLAALVLSLLLWLTRILPQVQTIAPIGK
jgi:tetrahydromethanopterin S-methyltransferase subunit G